MDAKLFDSSPGDVEFNFANAAVKGRRFVEATEKFEALARTTNSPRAWCGLGLAKSGLLMSDHATADEVAFCFETARSLDPQNADSLESLFADTALRSIAELYEIGRFSKAIQDTTKKKIKNGVLTVLVGSWIGDRKEASAYSTILGVGTTAVGVKSAYDAVEEHSAAQISEAKALIIINELETSVAKFAGKNQGVLDSFYAGSNIICEEVKRLEQADAAAREAASKTIFNDPPTAIKYFRQKVAKRFNGISDALNMPVGESANSNNLPASGIGNKKGKVMAGILAIFLGCLGVHKIYLGYTKEGVIMLLVTILTLGFGGFIMGIIGLIEGIIYLTKSDEEFVATYVTGRKGWF